MEVSPELKQQLATRIDMLIDVITGTIEPGSWENVGGWGAIRQSEATHSLVVRQTRDVHEQVHNLLAQLRSARRGDYGPLRSDINRMHKTQPPTDKPGATPAPTPAKSGAAAAPTPAKPGAAAAPSPAKPGAASAPTPAKPGAAATPKPAAGDKSAHAGHSHN